MDILMLGICLLNFVAMGLLVFWCDRLGKIQGN